MCGTQFSWQWIVLGRPDTPCYVASVATQQRQSRESRSGEPAHVARGVTWDAEQVEAAIAKEVLSSEFTDLECVVKDYLSQFSSTVFNVFLQRI